jgi:hypothetical protein
MYLMKQTKDEYVLIFENEEKKVTRNLNVSVRQMNGNEKKEELQFSLARHL